MGNVDLYVGYLCNEVFWMIDGEVVVIVCFDVDFVALWLIMGGGVDGLVVWCVDCSAFDVVVVL